MPRTFAAAGREGPLQHSCNHQQPPRLGTITFQRHNLSKLISSVLANTRLPSCISSRVISESTRVIRAQDWL